MPPSFLFYCSIAPNMPPCSEIYPISTVPVEQECHPRSYSSVPYLYPSLLFHNAEYAALFQSMSYPYCSRRASMPPWFLLYYSVYPTRLCSWLHYYTSPGSMQEPGPTLGLPVGAYTRPASLSQSLSGPADSHIPSPRHQRQVPSSFSLSLSLSTALSLSLSLSTMMFFPQFLSSCVFFGPLRLSILLFHVRILSQSLCLFLHSFTCRVGAAQPACLYSWSFHQSSQLT